MGPLLAFPIALHLAQPPLDLAVLLALPPISMLPSVKMVSFAQGEPQLVLFPAQYLLCAPPLEWLTNLRVCGILAL